MSLIKLIVVSESKFLTDSLRSLLQTPDDIEIMDVYNNRGEVIPLLYNTTAHIILLAMVGINKDELDFVSFLANNYPKPKILVVSLESNDDSIYKCIKSGAKGILTRDSNRQELVEAIYSLRNGYDYYSKSISKILINNFITTKDDEQKDKKYLLSKREIEVLKLWGEGNTNQEIANKLFISVRTVESHKNHIMQKINLKTTVDLVKYAIKNNIIEI